MLALDLNIEDNNVTLINIYGPNTDSPMFYEKIRDAMSFWSLTMIIIYFVGI